MVRASGREKLTVLNKWLKQRNKVINKNNKYNNIIKGKREEIRVKRNYSDR
jgi:hypothetical protein